MQTFVDKHQLILMEAAIVEPIRRGNLVPLDPLLVHVGLIYDTMGRNELHKLYVEYADIAIAADLPFLMCTPTGAPIPGACSAQMRTPTLTGKTGTPYFISFVIDRAGLVLGGTSFSDAIHVIDSETQEVPVGYLINCAYPSEIIGNSVVVYAKVKRMFVCSIGTVSCASLESLSRKQPVTYPLPFALIESNLCVHNRVSTGSCLGLPYRWRCRHWAAWCRQCFFRIPVLRICRSIRSLKRWVDLWRSQLLEF